MMSCIPRPADTVRRRVNRDGFAILYLSLFSVRWTRLSGFNLWSVSHLRALAVSNCADEKSTA